MRVKENRSGAPEWSWSGGSAIVIILTFKTSGGSGGSGGHIGEGALRGGSGGSGGEGVLNGGSGGGESGGGKVSNSGSICSTGNRSGGSGFEGSTGGLFVTETQADSETLERRVITRGNELGVGEAEASPLRETLRVILGGVPTRRSIASQWEFRTLAMVENLQCESMEIGRRRRRLGWCAREKSL